MNIFQKEIISTEKIKELEKKLVNKEYNDLEKLIETSNKNILEHPAIKIIYASSKSLKPNSNINEKQIAYKLFLEVYEKNLHFKQALYNACTLSLQIKEYDKILILLEEFIKKNDYNTKVYEAIYKIYVTLGKIDKAIQHLEIIIKKEPTNLKAYSAYLFCLLYSENYDQKDYIKHALDFSKKIKIYNENEKKPLLLRHNNKIKIGFITPHFDGNSIDGFLEDFLNNIDKKIFELNAFNLNLSDEKSDHLKHLFDNWYHVKDLNDLELINFIREKEINILIDLVGHGPDNRLTIFKNRAAPIQISWLGYCNSTGLKEMDYIIVDKFIVQDREKNLFSENFLYAPEIWNTHKLMNEDLNISSPPYLKNKYFTFGSFNNFSKISDKTVMVWSEILKKTEGKLVLKSSSQSKIELEKNIFDKFSNDLIKNNQIEILEGQRDKMEHMKLYNKIDLCLDTFPYNGVTTSFEAIWMGIPVLCLTGNNFVSRCGESINKNLGLSEFIAKDTNEYIEKAIYFSKKPNFLIEFRKNLRIKAKNSGIFQSKRFAEHIGNKLKEFWQKKTDLKK